MLTQCVKNACGQTDTKEHKSPASKPEPPSPHGIGLVLLLEYFLGTVEMLHNLYLLL